MDELVVHNSETVKFSPDKIKVIKSQIAKGATDDELSMFTHLCEKYSLDPFLKEIWFIKKVKKQKDSRGNWDYVKDSEGGIDYSKADTMIYTSRDGYLKVAQKDTSFNGIMSFAVRENDVFEIDADAYKVTHKFGAKRGNIIGAWAKVDHKQRKPVIVFADFKEYNTGKTTWLQYPTAMIIKVAEAQALKRQFGISGLVTKEELSHKLDDEPIHQAEVIEATIETPVITETAHKEPTPPVVQTEAQEEYYCNNCGVVITKKVRDYSKHALGAPLCFKCQKDKDVLKEIKDAVENNPFEGGK